MSVFTSLVTTTLEVPTDSGQSITIRKLAPKHLKAASRAAQMESLEDLKAIGGPAFLRELTALGADETAQRETVKAAAKADPLMTFDRLTLLEHGVTAWTYERALGPEALEDLDDETREWLAREVLKLARPALFAEDEGEAEQKND